jgi:glycosyltransferase involved in cell wall biosynthesis
MRIAVIMPVYNGADYLPAAIESLSSQTPDADITLIVVDDGSTDATPDTLQQMKARYDFIRIIRQENRGVSAAMNTGLRNVPQDADLVSFLDADDISPAGRYARDSKNFNGRPELDLTYSLVRRFEHTEDIADLSDGAGERIIQLGAGLYRRRVIEETGFFDEAFQQGGDGDYLFRIFERRPNCMFLDTVGIYYRQHPQSLTRDRETMRREYLMAYYKAIQRKRANPNIKGFPAEFAAAVRET